MEFAIIKKDNTAFTINELYRVGNCVIQHMAATENGVSVEMASYGADVSRCDRDGRARASENYRNDPRDDAEKFKLFMIDVSTATGDVLQINHRPENPTALFFYASGSNDFLKAVRAAFDASNTLINPVTNMTTHARKTPVRKGFFARMPA